MAQKRSSFQLINKNHRIEQFVAVKFVYNVPLVPKKFMLPAGSQGKCENVMCRISLTLMQQDINTNTCHYGYDSFQEKPVNRSILM